MGETAKTASGVSMNFKRRPFERTRLDHERASDKGIILTIRLNDDQLAWLLEAKQLLRLGGQSSTIKALAFIGYSVLLDRKSKALLSVVQSGKLVKSEIFGLNQGFK